MPVPYNEDPVFHPQGLRSRSRIVTHRLVNPGRFMKSGTIALAAAAFLLLNTSVLAADAPERLGPVEFDRSERYLFPSESVGDRFRIDVLLPLGYESSNEKYPVVYVTDANYLLYSAAASYLAQATGEMAKLIVVGVGWQVPSITRIRVRDFSPTCDGEYKERHAMTDEECGHADAFVSFLRSELRPFISRKYRSTDDNTLVGYSFGGLFALHVLFNHPDAFDRYLIGSANMRWDDEYAFKAEEAFAESNQDLAKRVYISVGGLEGEGLIPNTYRMYEKLQSRQYPGLQVTAEVLEGETHMTSINPFVLRGLRAVGFAR